MDDISTSKAFQVPNKMASEDEVDSVLSNYVRVASPYLHGITSRTEPDALRSEVVRLNMAVQAHAVGKTDPFRQPGDFLEVLREHRDEFTKAADLDVDNLGPAPARFPYLTLKEAAQQLESGAVTSQQLTQQALDRALETQPELNSFIEIWTDRALEQAYERDKEREQGVYRGVLHGIPLAHKDCFEVRGHKATIGSKVNLLPQAKKDATVIQRLYHAGSITVGTLSLNEMVAGPTGQNPAYGDCRNALDPSRISGGSSSGSGAAVAAGTIFGSLGSDTGGSIRLPASVNGLFGLKPTYGLIPRTGCFPRAFSLDCVGPLSRSAEDCALLLHAVAGYDPEDVSTIKTDVPNYPAQMNTAADRSRVGVINLSVEDTCHPDINASFELFIERVERNFRVAEISFSDFSACYAMGDIISKVEAATLHSQWMHDSPMEYSQAVYSRTEPGFHIPAVRYLEALMMRSSVLTEFLNGPMSEVDILICPTVPIPVPLRAEADMEKVGNVFNVVPTLTRLTRPLSYLGVPVLSMPVGYDKNGMPIGVQLIGRPFSEARLLSFAHHMTAN